MFSFFKKEKWAHIKTFTIDGVKCGGKNTGRVYIHLYESDKGNRKIETDCSYSEVSKESVDSFVRSLDLYQTKLLRWTNGRFDPEIPRYAQLGEEDTANALKGKVE